MGAGLLSSDLDFSPPSHLDFSYPPIWISLHHLPAPITWDKKHLTMSSLRELKSYIRRSFASYLGEEQLLRTIWVIAWSTTSHSWPWVGIIFQALRPLSGPSGSTLLALLCCHEKIIPRVIFGNSFVKHFCYHWIFNQECGPCQRSIYNWESSVEVRNSGGGSKICAALFWVGERERVLAE